jgi:hypothetical protein
VSPCLTFSNSRSPFFIPFAHFLQVAKGDFIHFQWTGSNANPQNNDGQGAAGSDRSNIVGQRPTSFIETNMMTSPITESPFATNYPKKLLQNDIVLDPSASAATLAAAQADALAASTSVATSSTSATGSTVKQMATATTKFNFLGWDKTSLTTLATLNTVSFGGDMGQFDDAGTYFDMGVRQVNVEGIFHYMCSRNNNFSNRSQKGKLVVAGADTRQNLIDWNGGSLATKAASVTVEKGSFTSVVPVSLKSFSASDAAQAPSLQDNVSDFVVVSPAVLPGGVKVSLAYKPNPLSFGSSKLMFASSATGSFSEVSGATMDGVTASTTTTQGGVYVVHSPVNIGATVGVAVGVAVFIVGLVLLYRYCAQKGEEDRAAAKGALI